MVVCPVPSLEVLGYALVPVDPQARLTLASWGANPGWVPYVRVIMAKGLNEGH